MAKFLKDYMTIHILHPSHDDPLQIRDCSLVITVSADVVALNGAKTSADTVLMANLAILSITFK